MKAAPFSVCICTYNGERYLQEQIRTIELQDRSLIAEIIAIDDQSSDSTYHILSEWAERDDLVKLYRNTATLGSTKNFARCIEIASSEYIVLCDQDDAWHASRLRAIWDEIQSKRPALVLHDASVIDGQDRVLLPSYFNRRTQGAGFNSGFLSNLVRNQYLGCCIVFSAELKQFLLPFPRFVSQHDIWIGQVASLVGEVCFLDAVMLGYRSHCLNVSTASTFTPHSLDRIIKYRVCYLVCETIAITRFVRSFFCRTSRVL